ncbi:hypothetical protein EYF80_054209 [Liparis tanakae]|uniref:Uncharacterized protein n=1 Tax=Liparis tanakae TaxID=230148 RepID=A0A4Z2F3J8_9TELE|nr:hypothetical protein EYF80_054209 [Liparis tanakae]
MKYFIFKSFTSSLDFTISPVDGGCTRGLEPQQEVQSVVLVASPLRQRRGVERSEGRNDLSADVYKDAAERRSLKSSRRARARPARSLVRRAEQFEKFLVDPPPTRFKMVAMVTKRTRNGRNIQKRKPCRAHGVNAQTTSAWSELKAMKRRDRRIIGVLLTLREKNTLVGSSLR